MAKKEKKKVWEKVPATAFKSEEELKKAEAGESLNLQDGLGKNKRKKYEEKLALDISFEDLIKLSVTDIDKPKK